MSRTLKIAVVDDEPDMRESISQWLALSGFDAETYASADDALKVIGADWPGVVISDIRMPGMDGMAFLKRLMGIDSGLPVIMITGHGDVPMAVSTLKNGAYDFVEKPCNDNELVDRVIEALKLDAQKRVTAASVESIQSRLKRLTARERQVMELVLAGKLNKLIADELQVSMRTVEVYRASLFEKMGVRTAVDLSRLCAHLDGGN